MARVGLLLALGLAASGCDAVTIFACERPGDCVDGPIGGACEVDGHCSFPDPRCDSGRRYGEHAPTDIAGTCVPQPDEAPTWATDHDDASTTAPASDSTGEPRSGDTTGGDDDGLDESTGGESSSDTGEPMADESSTETSTGADEPVDCDALDCAACIDCAVQADGPCGEEQIACEAANGCTSGVACQHECMLYGFCFEDCCHGEVDVLVDDVMLCAADRCVEACEAYEVLTCG